MVQRVVIISVFVTTCFLGLLGLVLYSSLFGISAQVVLSGSMRPNLAPGDLVLVRQMPAGAYREGDVVSFTIPGPERTLVTHRISHIYQVNGGVSMVDTKGDANTNGDAWHIPTTSIIGKRILTIPWLGYLCAELQTPPGYLLVVLGTFIILIAPEVRYIFQVFFGGFRRVFIPNH